jgi:hypothetical protein
LIFNGIIIIIIIIIIIGGTWWHSWLRHYATSRKPWESVNSAFKRVKVSLYTSYLDSRPFPPTRNCVPNYPITFIFTFTSLRISYSWDNADALPYDTFTSICNYTVGLWLTHLWGHILP